jgi:hypothetical protein
MTPSSTTTRLEKEAVKKHHERVNTNNGADESTLQLQSVAIHINK